MKSNTWKPKFGHVKSQDPRDQAVFKQVVKKNPYIRSATYLSQPAAQTQGTNSEIY